MEKVKKHTPKIARYLPVALFGHAMTNLSMYLELPVEVAFFTFLTSVLCIPVCHNIAQTIVGFAEILDKRNNS